MVKKKSSITLSQACKAMILYSQADGTPPHTISYHQNTFKKLAMFVESDFHEYTFGGDSRYVIPCYGMIGVRPSIKSINKG